MGRLTKAGASRIPGHLDALNNLARSQGIRVAVSFDGENIVTKWSGSQQALRATGLVLSSYHFPQRRGQFVYPLNAGFYAREFGVLFLDGEVCVEGDHFELVSRSNVPIEIRSEHNIETCTFNDLSAFFGAREALIAARICQPAQFPGPKHGIKRRSYRLNDSVDWFTLWHPCDGYVHFRESEASMSARLAEEAARQMEQDGGSKQAARYRTPEEHMELLEDYVVTMARGLLSPMFTSFEICEGCRYTLDSASLAHVVNAIEVAAQGFRNVPVKVERLKNEREQTATREAAAAASTDAEFQQFLSRLPKS